MKKLLFILMLALPMLCQAQSLQLPIDTALKAVVFTNVVETKGSKTDLYKKGVEFMATAFNSSKDVVQIKDEAEGKIIGKFKIQMQGSSLSFVMVKISLYFKDNKYKYVFDDFLFEGVNGNWDLYSEISPWRISKQSQKYIVNRVNDEINDLIKTLKVEIDKKSASDF